MCFFVFQEIEKESNKRKKERLFFRKKSKDKDTDTYGKTFVQHEVQTHDKKRKLQYFLECRKPIQLIDMGKMKQIEDD